MANLNTGLTAAQIMQAFGNALDSNIHMTAEEKEKLASLENYDDTEVKQDISDLTDDLENIYGLGTLIPDNSDLDDYKTPGAYYISTPASAQTLYNCPAQFSFRLEVTTLNGDARFIQTIEEAVYNSSETTGLNIYKRAYTVRGWSDWYLYTGTVAQPINVPT